MTRQGASLRVGSWIWLAPVVMMACLPPRPTLMQEGTDGGGADRGPSAIDTGAGAIDAGSGKPDVKPDGSVGGVDAGGCVAGAHLCGGQCVSNTDVAHCAQSCSPCFVPTGGTATCDGVSCGSTCPSGSRLCSTACAPQTMSCAGDCPGGSHDCSGTCLPNGAVGSCGSSCMPCVAPTQGTATCDGAQCGFTCAGGYHPCGTQCLSNTDVASCGSSCSACPVPSGGTATCDGTSCGGTCPSGTKLCVGNCIPTGQSCMGSCAAGTHACNNLCQSNTSPNTCGSSSCTPCTPPANGVATCDGTQCGFNCSVGFHLCGNACVANSGVANCGTTSCSACAAPVNGAATCDGLQCGFQCSGGFHACNSICVSSGNVQTCGQSCTACPVPSNGIATCDGTSCGIACSNGFHNCGGLCVSNNSVQTCGTSCTACSVPTIGTATCDGTSCGVSIPTFNLTVSAAGAGGATGTVTVSPVGTSCGTGCFTYNQGTSVKITESPTGTATFTAWSGDCTGQGAACTLTMSSDHTAVAHFRPNMNMVFVTSALALVPGQIGSNLATADAYCVSTAKAAFLGGTVWKAWLATTSVSASTHVGASTTGWIRTDGQPFATSMANLQAGKIYYPLRFSESGVDRESQAVMSGAQGDGTPVSGGTCGDWTSTTGPVAIGVTSSTTGSWTFQGLETDSCGIAIAFYCFENDSGMAAVPAPVAPANARHAFLSTTLFSPGNGIASADALCQADATSANLANPSNYRALLTTTVAATDSTRISVSGQPWYRLDGAQLFGAAADINDPLSQKMLTGLNLTPAGQYLGGLAWTGSQTAPSSTAMVANCNNWTSSSATLLGFTGLATNSFGWWWPGYGPQDPCSIPKPIYCFEK